MKKGNMILGIGILVFSITLLIDHIARIPDFVSGLLIGIGVGLELVGVIFLFRKRRSQ